MRTALSEGCQRDMAAWGQKLGREPGVGLGDLGVHRSVRGHSTGKEEQRCWKEALAGREGPQTADSFGPRALRDFEFYSKHM